MDQLAYLFSLEQFGIKFGLDNIEALLARLGHPERTFRSVHVAGTNGKGSVTAMVDTALGRAGYRSARYTSPHLVDLSERFVIDGRPVDAAAMRSAAGDVREAIEELRAEGALQAPPTFFEATTALAFELFRRAQVEVAVVEVGLGGRLDSTNVIEPVVTAITSIDFDHQQYLGSTLREIAAEKAGIIKPGVPVVVGRRGSGSVGRHRARRPRARRRAHPRRRRRGCAARLTPGVAARQRVPAPTPARDYGTFQAGPARRASDRQRDRGRAPARDARRPRRGRPAGAIVDGLEQVSWPGRLERRTLSGGRELILDAAHNPAGAAALASYLTSAGGTPPVLVFAAMRDKDARGMLRVLLPAVGRVIVTRAANPRSADPDALAAEVRAISPSVGVDVVPAPVEALGAAWTDLAARRRGGIDISSRRHHEGDRRVIRFESTPPSLMDIVSRLPSIPPIRVIAGVLLMVAGAGTAAAQGVPGFDNVISERQVRIGENRIQLSGQVELKRGDIELYADEVEIFTDSDRAVATGNVVLVQTGNRIAAERVDFNYKTRLGTFYRRTASPTSSRRCRGPAPWRSPACRARKPTCISRARPSRRSAPKKYKITNGGFTTCVQPTPRWELPRGHGRAEHRPLHAAPQRDVQRQGRPDAVHAGPVLPDQEGRPRDRHPDSDVRFVGAARPVPPQRVLLGARAAART